MANRDAANDFCPGTNHHVVLQNRMTVACRLTRSTQCNTLIQRDMITDDACFTNHNPAAMVYEKVAADLCTGMNINTGFLLCTQGKKSGQCIMTFQIQFVAGIPCIQGSEPGKKQDLHRAFQGRIPLFYGSDLSQGELQFIHDSIINSGFLREQTVASFTRRRKNESGTGHAGQS